MFKKIISIFTLSLFLCTSGSLIASSSTPIIQEKTISSEKSEPVQIRLIGEETSIQPGKPFWVGLEVKLEEGWDTYWINPGDAGFPINVTWNLPENFQVSPLHWPYPERFMSQSLVGFGYTHSVVLLAEITPPKDLAINKDINLSANVNWLACKEQCVPGSANIQLALPVKSDPPQKDNTVASQFLKARQEIPQKEEKLSIKAQQESLVLGFEFDVGDIAEAYFMSETLEVVDHTAPQVLKKADDGYILNMKLVAGTKEIPNHVKGVLVISQKGSEVKKAIQVDSDIASSNVTSHGMLRFEVALLCAFLGGLILNVMPCVLPVISLKIFSFIKMADKKRHEIFKQGILFTAGVLISFWALSVLLLLLRASGEGIGWGFQLQEPTFVILLILVLFLLGLSLFGIFELGTSLMSVGAKISGKGSFFKGSFMNGVLATLVATPCTGPLLGPALGLAMTLPAFSSLLIFTMMGLGMAAPYLIISAFPKLIRFLPKPGDWMIVFKQFMGFLMMATCAWLIWVFAGQTDHLALLVLLVTLLVFSMSAWVYGKWGSITSKRKTRYMATSIALLMMISGGTVALKTVHDHRQMTTTQNQESAWQPYSEEKVAALRKEGKPVFVDFTAKWCLICQANKITLHSAEIQKAFNEKHVVFMEGDWTMKDAAITAELHKLGRSGVPVYALYPADPKKPPHILPQTLTKSIVNDYLNKLTE